MTQRRLVSTEPQYSAGCTRHWRGAIAEALTDGPEMLTAVNELSVSLF